MITLAIELSTDSGSLALLEEHRVLLERMWTEDRQHRQQVFAEIERCVAGGLIDLGRVDLLAVGVGPGAFSGLRMAVSTMRAMAMPDGKPVFGVASAEALAWETLQETGRNSVCVLGDARCNELWRGCFYRGDEWPRREGDWLVTGGAVLSDQKSVWVTSDWDRIGGQLRRLCPVGADLIEARRVPSARSVGRLAAAKYRAGVDSELLAPIYVHPAVSTPPTFWKEKSDDTTRKRSSHT